MNYLANRHHETQPRARRSFSEDGKGSEKNREGNPHLKKQKADPEVGFFIPPNQGRSKTVRCKAEDRDCHGGVRPYVGEQGPTAQRSQLAVFQRPPYLVSHVVIDGFVDTRIF